MKRRTTYELFRALFELLGLFRLKDATVPELLAIDPSSPRASLYRNVHRLHELHWLNERGRRGRTSKREKSARIWGITQAGIIMLQAWENAEQYLRFWRDPPSILRDSQTSEEL